MFKKIKKFPSVWEKMSENRRGDFLTHTVVVESVTVCIYCTSMVLVVLVVAETQIQIKILFSAINRN